MEFRWIGTNRQSRARAACGWHNPGVAGQRIFRSPARLRAPTHRAGPDAAAPLHRRTSKSLSASVTHCLSVISSVARAQQFSAPEIDHNTLRIAPGMAIHNLLSFSLQKTNRIERNPVLYHQTVRKPLVVKTKRIHRRLQVQPIVDDSHQNIRDGRDDGGTAW